ncbi:C39 family peptidase [Micromonospora sp. NPDC049679]|uniref:C39 family peptidase n=1 Tax=Micromonospora sp. NPDC049679 TaxID=3155920 RepID=UPI0033C3CAB1
MQANAVLVRDIAYRGFRTATQFGAGTGDGVAVSGDTLVLATPLAVRDETDPHSRVTATYDFGMWTSPPVSPGFAATEIIPSWTADTPPGCWIQVELRGTTPQGATTPWFVLARWTAEEAGISRSSVPAQSGPDGSVAADILITAADRPLTAWQLRVTLLRPAGTLLTPVLRSAGAVASRLPGPVATLPSAPQTARGAILDVPRYSQKTHAGHHPEWGDGGESWCSPTSTSMVLAFWGVGPTPGDYAWVGPDHADPWVDHAARHCYDHAYGGTGNWPFNTAYAGRYGLDGFVTRLRSLAEAELFIAAGIPLIVSASYTKDQITGLDYDTAGHVMVLVGFTASGDPVLHDPAAPTNDAVRRPVPRAAFETAWLDSSRGLVYVIRPAAVPLPPSPPQANW